MRNILRFFDGYRLAIVAVVVFVFLQTMADLFLPTLMAEIVNQGVIKGDIPYIWRVGGIMLLVAAAGACFSVTVSFLSARVSAGFAKKLRAAVFRYVESFAIQEFHQLGTASLITRTTNDINQLQQVVVMMLRMMIMAPLMGVGGIIMAISRDAQLSWVFVVSIPVLAATITTIALKGMPLFKLLQRKLDRLNLIQREALTGIRVIRAFHRTNFELERFDRANFDLTRTAITVNQIMAAMMPLMMLILNLSIIGVIWFGSIRIDYGGMQIGDLMAFIQYAMQIMFSLMMLAMMFVLIPRASVSVARISEVLETVPTVGEKLPSDRVPTSTRSGTVPEGIVEFRDVTYSYPGAEKPALSNISFTAKPGQVTAIIGGTGSGKSTLVQLIPRFFDVDSGSVLVNGIDVRDWPLKELREQIGLVPQKAVLFSGTVADNIRFGHEQATAEEVKYAAEVAQAAEFIDELPEGYDAPITQGGANLSGGQKQRLSIARAIVRRPRIYLLDDCFSALDYKTDAKLRAALRKETESATVIIVAQRVSTVMDADQIIVLDEGRIAGYGTHRELLEQCALYKEIVASQLTEEEIA